MTERLHPLTFPLHGSRLIEASAGTGKTFTIAALYLRLILGHGADGTAYARALTPPEILVVTFTDAATGELRDRIRARLVDAAICFSADPADQVARPAGEDFLHDLRASYPERAWPACARRLRLAADAMDEAAISTIHGWCNRMLREHAFDSDSLFTQTLEPNQDELVADAVRDYWRTFYYPLDEADATRIAQWWATPDALQAQLRRLLSLPMGDTPRPDPSTLLRQAEAQRRETLAALKAPWLDWIRELREVYRAWIDTKQVGHRQADVQRWLDTLAAWAEGDDDSPALTPTAWKHLSPDGLAAAWKGEGPAPHHAALDATAALRQSLATLPDGREAALCHAIQWVAQRFAQAQDRRAAVGFDDLLRQLDKALAGPNGPTLAALIRRQFPVALIDEFQDTDAVQYRIFDAVYGVAHNDPQTALILIGDPKQAIYAFRGADIHTYLQARRDTEGRHTTLDTNFRSTAGMVAAVNRVFDCAEQRDEGRGAFYFRTARGDNPLPFHAVAARGRSERLRVDGTDAAALTCWWLPQDKPLSAGAHTTRMADACAAEIVRLLQLGQQARAGFQADGDALRPLVAQDIAVLVNTGTEAIAVRRALDACGVRSVYLSDQQSVFASAVAADLQRWLAACAEPTDGRLLRAALGTATLQLSLAELDRLNHDELHWETRTQQFVEYLHCWRRQGVLPMLRRLLHDFDTPQRLLARGDERALTDVLHLAELLQVAGEQLDGEHALIRHLEEQRSAGEGDPGVRQVRLESDAELVQVVTVHKSKGLEYPLVFLPFASAFRKAKATDVPLRWHDDNGELQVRLSAAEPGALAQVDAERLGEDLRKLYVALTRARFATWMGVAPLEHFEQGALGYLLTEHSPVAPAGFEAMLDNFAAGCDAVAVVRAPLCEGQRYEPTPTPPAAAVSRVLPQRREHWWIASYSALRSVDPAPRGSRTAPAPENAAEGVYEEVLLAEHLAERLAEPAGLGAGSGEGPHDTPLPADTSSRTSLHAFPRGAEAGSFLHGLLEWAGTEGFDAVRHHPTALHDQVARRCNVQGWSHWITPLHHWLSDWVGTPLPLAPGVAVAPQAMAQVKVELEFWFGVHHVDTRRLDALVQQHVLPGQARPPLTATHVNGMLKGFIDLVVAHEGRYYLVDYKSNWLGTDDHAYTAAAVQDAVLQHRYELQYSLYVFALHRLLKARQHDYDYDRHIGGAACVFLRGHAAPGRGVHLDRPPRAFIDALEQLFDPASPPTSTADPEVGP